MCIQRLFFIFTAQVVTTSYDMLVDWKVLRSLGMRSSCVALFNKLQSE